MMFPSITVSDVRDFVLEAAINKAKWAAKALLPPDQEGFISFRKIARTLVRVSNQKSINVLSTLLLNDKLPFHFFILLEEMVARKMDTAEVESQFRALISIHTYDVQMVDTFLRILGKDASYLTHQLLDDGHQLILNYWILAYQFNRTPNSLKEHIVPAIVKHYRGSNVRYWDLVLDTLQVDISCVKSMLHNSDTMGQCQGSFAQYLIGNHSHNALAIKNYAMYLDIHYPAQFTTFEDNFLNSCQQSGQVLSYVSDVPFANKRKVLSRLIALGNEASTIRFINKFPAYQNLMSMF